MAAGGDPTYGVEIIARLLNLTPRRVQQLAKDGVIPKAERGEYALAPCVTGYCKFIQDKLSNPEGASRGTLNQEKIRKTKAEADIVEMEAAKMKGELISAAELTEVLEPIISEIRTKLLNNTPTRIAARAKSEKKQGSIKAIAKDEISQALKSLSSADPATLLVAG